MKTIFVCTYICINFLFIYCVNAQSLRYAVAMPFKGLSAYSVKQNDAFSFTENQAALTQINQPCIGFYAENRFLLDALNYYYLAFAMPTKMGQFGVEINYNGFKNFSESKLGLAYAKSLGKKIDIGIQFNYYNYRIPSYGNSSTINFEAGAIFHFTPALNIGIHVYNPISATLNKVENEKLASVYKLGFGYDASDNFFISAECIKEEDKAVNFVTGFQYQFAKQFFAKLGFSSKLSTVFTSIGAGWKNNRIDIAVSYHPQLGVSPGIFFITNFSSKK